MKKFLLCSLLCLASLSARAEEECEGGGKTAPGERIIRTQECRAVKQDESCKPGEQTWIKGGFPACCKEVEVDMGPCF